MADNANSYNFDEVVEYFEFTYKGFKYRFKQPTASEIEALSKLEDKDTKKVFEHFDKFVTKLDKEAPDFTDLYKTFTVAHLRKFLVMLKTEFGVDVK